MAITSKKKIIIIGPTYPYRGGNSLYVSHLYESLNSDFDVKIFNYKVLYPSLLFPGTTQYDVSNSVLKNTPNERLINSISPFNWIKIAKRINNENPDLIVFDWWHPFFAFCHRAISQLLKPELKKKVLFITENFISHESRSLEHLLTKFGLKKATSFLALSAQVENDLATISSGRKIYRSELPIFDCYEINKDESDLTAREALGYKKDDLVLLFFGYIRKYKGLDLLIDTFPSIIKLFKDAKLLIVGESYEDINFYKEKIKQTGCENSIVLENKFVPNEEVGKYYLAADAVILPYRSATQSGILNIAYGFSKPVIVTKVGGLSEFVLNEQTGIIVEPDSIEDLVQGVKRFVELRNDVDFTANIKDFVQKNGFANISKLVLQIIEEIKL